MLTTSDCSGSIPFVQHLHPDTFTFLLWMTNKCVTNDCHVVPFRLKQFHIQPSKHIRNRHIQLCVCKTISHSQASALDFHNDWQGRTSKRRSGQIEQYALEPDAIPRSFTERVKILLQFRPLTLLFSIQPAIWIESHRIGVDFRVQKREMRIHAHRCARLDSPILVTQCLIRRYADQARCGNSIDTQTFCDAGSLLLIKTRSLHH